MSVTSVTSTKLSRVALTLHVHVEEMEHLKVRIQNNKFDVSAWEQLAGLIRTSHHAFKEVQEVFEQLLAVFPSAVRRCCSFGRFRRCGVQSGQWKAYAEAAMLANEQTAAKTIFSRCLLAYPNVELWNTYLRFIRNVARAWRRRSRLRGRL